jgi:hypothetical protein
MTMYGRHTALNKNSVGQILLLTNIPSTHITDRLLVAQLSTYFASPERLKGPFQAGQNNSQIWNSSVKTHSIILTSAPNLRIQSMTIGRALSFTSSLLPL